MKFDIETARTWRRPAGAYLALALIAAFSLHRTTLGDWTAEDVAALTVLAGMWGWDNLMRSQEIRAAGRGANNANTENP